MKAAHLLTSDYIVLAGYFILLMAIGLYFLRYMKGVEDYFTGGNQIPWWLAGISHFMSSISAFVFVAYSEIAYKYGLVALTMWWMVVPGCLLGAFVFSGLWRKARILSPVEFLESRYNNSLRQVFAWAGIPVKIIMDGLRLYAVGLFVSVGMGLDLKTGVIAAGLVTLAYTFLGGVWAVTISDVLQFVVLTLAVLLILPLAWDRVGGLEGFAAKAPAGFFHVTGGPYDWFYLSSFILIAAMSYNGTWSIVQRFYCVKEDREAKKTALLAAGLNVIGPIIFLIPPMIARVLIPDLATPPKSAQYAYAALGLELLPAGMMGILIAAMLAAAMGALSADYNALSSVLTNDIYKRMINPNASARQLHRVGMIGTVIAGTLAIGVSLTILSSGQTGLFNKMMVLFGLALGPTVLPMLAGLISRRITARGALAGFIGGFVSGVSLYLYRTLYLETQPGLNPQWVTFTFTAYSTFINIGVTLGAMILVSFLEHRSAVEDRKIDAFFARMNEPIRNVDVRKDLAPSPFFIVGLVLIGLGIVLGVAGWFTPSASAQYLDWAIGLIFACIGVTLYLLHRRSFQAAVLLNAKAGPAPSMKGTNG